MAQWPTTGNFSRCLRANNPGPMTLTGTNSYVIGNVDSQELVVVDPGPLLESHLRELAQAGTIGLILLTHRHDDHSGGVDYLHQLTGAPVRAMDSSFCRGAEVLHDGEILDQAGTPIHVLATPGHTEDSVCFFIPDDGLNGSLLSGDTILGQGTTVLDHPRGTLADYMASLGQLEQLAANSGPIALLPGHGPVLPDLGQIVTSYTLHRRQRLAEVREAVDLLESSNRSGFTAENVADLVYPQVPDRLRAAAVISISAQLEYLRS